MIEEKEENGNEISLVDDSEEKLKQKLAEFKISIDHDISDLKLRKEKVEYLMKTYSGDRFRNSVWEEKNLFENNDQERIYSMSNENLRFLIDYHSEVGDLILDPFAGYLNSATTILSMQRRYIGYEINPSHFSKLRDRIQILKERREDAYLDFPEFKIFNKDSQFMDHENIDLIITTLPRPDFPEERKGKEKRMEDYVRYLDMIKPVLLKSYEALKDNSFMIVHFSDSVRGLVYIPIFVDILNILRDHMSLKYALILSQSRSPAGNLKDNGEKFKLYSEQIFPLSHQYVFCFHKGEGRLR